MAALISGATTVCTQPVSSATRTRWPTAAPAADSSASSCSDSTLKNRMPAAVSAPACGNSCSGAVTSACVNPAAIGGGEEVRHVVLARIAVALGIRELRLTGGEPLVRRGFVDLIERLSRHLESGALEELTLTTNGSQLARYATELAAHGVRRFAQSAILLP